MAKLVSHLLGQVSQTPIGKRDNRHLSGESHWGQCWGLRRSSCRYQFSIHYWALEGIATLLTPGANSFGLLKQCQPCLVVGDILSTPSSWPRMTFLDTRVLNHHQPWGLSQSLGNTMWWLSGGMKEKIKGELPHQHFEVWDTHDPLNQ